MRLLRSMPLFCVWRIVRCKLRSKLKISLVSNVLVLRLSLCSLLFAFWAPHGIIMRAKSSSQHTHTHWRSFDTRNGDLSDTYRNRCMPISINSVWRKIMLTCTGWIGWHEGKTVGITFELHEAAGVRNRWCRKLSNLIDFQTTQNASAENERRTTIIYTCRLYAHRRPHTHTLTPASQPAKSFAYAKRQVITSAGTHSNSGPYIKL